MTVGSGFTCYWQQLPFSRLGGRRSWLEGIGKSVWWLMSYTYAHQLTATLAVYRHAEASPATTAKSRILAQMSRNPRRWALSSRTCP
jgi:hypothetical protein